MSGDRRRMIRGSLDSAPASDDAARLDAALPDQDWSVLPPGAVRGHFDAPSGSLATFSLGDPSHPRIVLVPGVTGSKEDFLLLAPLLADAGYFVQSYDLAGQYESAAAGPGAAGHYGYELFVADMIAFLEDSSPAHLLGYSFAGVVAELVVVRRPELCRSLTLLATPPQPGKAFHRVKWIGWLSRLLSARAIASLMIWGVTTNMNRVAPGRLAFAQARFDLTDRASVDDVMALMMAIPDVRPALAAEPLSKLIVVGVHDLWPLRLHARFAERIGARIAVYRTGHRPCETAPNQLARDLLELYRD